jgi:hypothetical protein
MTRCTIHALESPPPLAVYPYSPARNRSIASWEAL